MQNNIKITPAYLRIGLSVSIGILFVAGAVGFYFFQSSLVDYANKVNADALIASSGDLDVAKLQTLKKQLVDNKVGVERAKSIVADSQKYQYQNQIIDDFNAFANSAGFEIQNFAFSDPATINTSAALPGAIPGGSAIKTVLPTPPGLKTTIATISFSKALTYVELMNFLKTIEDNLTKMEITGISITGNPSDGTIKTNPITIEVYIHAA